VAFARGESSPGPVRFRHETHMREGTACQACHPKPYRMKATGGRPGGAMHEPASCGACHDGRKAFGVEDAESCALCHAQGAQP
jgi:c(7)-type cytochrome triheme protein